MAVTLGEFVRVLLPQGEDWYSRRTNMADGLCTFVVAVCLVMAATGLQPTASTPAHKTSLCPPMCACLGNTVVCSKKGLSSVPRDLPEWTEAVDLSSNNISEIPVGIFAGLHRLKELNLNNNQLRVINASSLMHLSSLDTLKCGYNKLTEIPELPLESNVTHLHLHHNEISSVKYTSLLAVPNLRQLDLSFNKITSLGKDSFPFLPNLQQLFINHNRIQKLDLGSMNNLTGLEWLKLKKNRIQTLPKGLFLMTHKLKYLELSRNKLQALEGLGFEGLDNLVSLKLRRNSISQLQDGAFYGLKKIQNLQLDNNNITLITKGWLYGLESLQQLSLSHNYIFKVEDGGWQSCSHLWELDLTHNEMTAIKQETFKGLDSLQYLIVNYNRVSYIEDGALKELPALLVLEMNHNEISWTIEDTNGAFDGLVSLTRLGLDSNHIKSIARHAFQGLQQLKHLNLVDNGITTIQSNAFEPLQDLQELHFNSSNLLCDCHLSWLPDWLQERGFGGSINAQCSHPESLRGRSVLELNISDFKCDDFPRPVISQPPENMIARKGRNASLVCEATSSDQSPLHIQWKKDNVVLPTSNVENRESVTESGMTQLRSNYHLRQVADEDAGLYQCVVSNALGSAYSQKAQITVHVFPVFTKHPADVTVKAGSKARLECAATGQPAPVIAWQKDGGDDFPAARERRMHVRPADHVFFIMNVKDVDQGVYSCTASNDAGTSITNATVNVLVTPSFTKPMEDKETRVGETTVLECMASGTPKPRLVWLKDGQPLEITPRHFLTAGNQLLVIVHTEVSDNGLYTCEMSNTLGTERGVSELTVITHNSYQGDSQDEQAEEDSTTTGIIIIAVVCCVVGTSLIWVIIIYHTRKRTEEYSSTPTEDTTLPGELAPVSYHGHVPDGSSGLLPASYTSTYSKYSGLEMNGGLNFANKCRTAAIFPSDVEDDDHRQQIPLTMDEQHPAQASDTSITLLRRGGSGAHSDSETTPSSHSSLHSSRSTSFLHSFHPHLATANTSNSNSNPPPLPLATGGEGRGEEGVEEGIVGGHHGSQPPGTQHSTELCGGGNVQCFGDTATLPTSLSSSSSSPSSSSPTPHTSTHTQLPSPVLCSHAKDHPAEKKRSPSTNISESTSTSPEADVCNQKSPEIKMPFTPSASTSLHSSVSSVCQCASINSQADSRPACSCSSTNNANSNSNLHISLDNQKKALSDMIQSASPSQSSSSNQHAASIPLPSSASMSEMLSSSSANNDRTSYSLH